MRATLALLLSLLWIASSAPAQVAAPGLSGKALAQSAQAPAGTPSRVVKGKRRLHQTAQARTAKPTTDAEALASCLAMWDRGTHMSKQEWSRACRRVAARLKDTTVQ